MTSSAYPTSAPAVSEEDHTGPTRSLKRRSPLVLDRNLEILDLHGDGWSVELLSIEFGLTEAVIRKVIEGGRLLGRGRVRRLGETSDIAVDEVHVRIGARLASYREGTKEDLTAMAFRLLTSRRTAERMERGVHPLSLLHLRRIASMIGVSEAELLAA